MLTRREIHGDRRFLLSEVVLKLTETGWLASVGENAELASV